MDCCIFTNPSFKILPWASSFSSFSTSPVVFPVNRRRIIVVASSRNNSQCDFSSLNTPLELKSQTGKFLSRVLQNDRKNFHHAVAGQLDHLVSERDEALARFSLSLGSSHASLYRFMTHFTYNYFCFLYIYLHFLFMFSWIKLLLFLWIYLCWSFVFYNCDESWICICCSIGP